MQSTSALYKQILSETNHWFEIAVTIGDSGVLIDENKDWIDFGELWLEGSYIDSQTGILVETGSPDDGIRENALLSLSTSNQLFSGNTPSIGNAVAGQIDLKLIDLGFEIPRMAEIRPYVRATDGTYTSEWIPQGVYYIDTRYVTQNDDDLDIWTITGYDAMLKAEQAYPYDTTAKASTVVKNIASLMGLSNAMIDSHVWEIIPSSGGDSIQCSGEYTCREHLQFIAALYGGNWTITNEGKLNLIALNDIPYESNLLTDEVGYTLRFGGDTGTWTATGSVVVLGAENSAVDDLSVAIEPVQSGSGDPSPTNIRPISGWAEANVYVNDEYSTSGATVYNVDWSSDAGTVYCGMLDVTTGVLTVTKAGITYAGTESWKVSSLGVTNAQRFYCYLDSDKYASSVASERAASLCSITTNVSDNGNAGSFPKTVVATNMIKILDGSSDHKFSSLTDFKSWLTGLYSNNTPFQVVYPLATPITYQLTAQEVTTLLGENFIWADTGNVTVTWTADEESDGTRVVVGA